MVLAAKSRKVPAIIHESDMTPGLANKLCIPSAFKVCCNFPETIKNLPEGKAVLSGSPIRKELFDGNRLTGLDLCGFSINKPVILIVGGSLGSAAINKAVRDNLPFLLKQYQIIHICGKDKVDHGLDHIQGYIQFEYVKKELSDLLDAADVIISRAGANAICELLALRKPNILIPLPAASSRGDQILNAESFKRQGFSFLLKEEDLTSETLLDAITETFKNRTKYIEAMATSPLNNAIDMIVNLINEAAGKQD